MYKNIYYIIKNSFRYMGVGIWGKKHSFIHSQSLDSNCHVKTISQTSQGLDSNNCHVERSEISNIKYRKDFSLTLKMTRSNRVKRTTSKPIRIIGQQTQRNKKHGKQNEETQTINTQEAQTTKQNPWSVNIQQIKQGVGDLDSKATCHVERSETSSSNSKKDISPMAQYDKTLESKTIDCHIERSEISSQDSKKDFSLTLKMTSKQSVKDMETNVAGITHKTANMKIKGIKTKKDISPMAQYDKTLESKTIDCHVERSETSSQDSKRDFSLSLKMTRKHKMTRLLFLKMTRKQKTTNIKKRFFSVAQNDKKTQMQYDKNAFSQNDKIIQTENDKEIHDTHTTKQKVKSIKAKAVILCLFSCMFYAKMSANGFKIQEQSLNATALSSAYVAGARGADASYYNPANMGFKNDWGEDKHEFEFAFSLINIPGFKFQVPTTNQGLSSVTYMEYEASLEALDKLFPLPMPRKIELQHTKADSAMVDGSTGDTNFMLPKFFYKSKNYNGFTFGASFIAPSGLAMKWNGLGGEFLQDVFIFLIEFAPSISYTYRDRISVGFAPRLLYGMGKFNNVVYVPLGTAQQQDKNPTDGTLPGHSNNPEAGKNCTPAFNPDILQSLPEGLIPKEYAQIFEAIETNSGGIKELLKAIGITIPENATQLEIIQAMVKNIQTCLVGTAQVVQKSDGSDIGFGYRASVSARVGDGGMFSVVYNSPVAMQFKGKVSADTIIGGPVGSVRMDAPLYLYVTMPEILTIAYSHDWTFKNKHKLRLEATYERTFWSRGRKFDTEFGWDEAKFTASPGSVPESFSQEQLMGMVGLADFSAVAMGNGWVDTHTFRVGATYITKRLRLMLSAAYDKAPVPQTAIGIPDSNGYMIGLGAKYNFRDFDVGVSLSNTFKDSSSSIYASGGVGQLRIATFSLGYRW